VKFRGQQEKIELEDRLQDEAKNFDKENLHHPKFDRVICALTFWRKSVYGLSAIFCMNADFTYH
jgi:hypothetical protein